MERRRLLQSTELLVTVDLARLPEALRDHGLRVEETPGWLTRGYDYVRFVGQLSHHTGGSGPVGAITRDFVTRGRVGANEPNPLEGPLCNSLEGIAVDGVYTVYLIAGRRARHAGPGSPVVYSEFLSNVHVERTAGQRGLADDENTHGNRSLFGREVHHPGSGAWADELLEGLGLSSAALTELAGWHPNRHKGHKHWTRRKPDPSWTGSLPGLTARYLEDHMPLSDDDIKRITAALAPVVQKEVREEVQAQAQFLAGGSNSLYDSKFRDARDVEQPVSTAALNEKLDRLLAAGGFPLLGEVQVSGVLTLAPKPTP